MIKKIFLYLLLLLPWFISSIFAFDTSYYQEIVLPFFAPNKIIFPIVWTIIYLMIAFSEWIIVNEYSIKNISKSYKIRLIINYLFNQSFPLFFFTLKSPFLGFVSSIGTFISSLYLYEESTNLNKKSSKYLNLYILWNLFATVLSLAIFILNS